jgi:hypothetical protein
MLEKTLKLVVLLFDSIVLYFALDEWIPNLLTEHPATLVFIWLLFTEVYWYMNKSNDKKVG